MISKQSRRMAVRMGLTSLAMTLVIASAPTVLAQLSLYNPSSPVSVGTNSVIVWDLDQGVGTTATDQANPILDGDNAGTLTGPAVSWTTGKFGGGVNFLGGSAAAQPENVGYVTSSVTGALFTQQACMAAWIKPAQVNPTFGFNYIMGWNGPDTAGAFLRFNSATALGFGIRVRTAGGTYQWAEVSYEMPFNVFDGTWRHVAGTFNDGVLKLYVNGIEAAAHFSGYTSAAGYYIIPPTSFQVGGVYDDPADTRLNYAGGIDDVRFLNFDPTPPPPPFPFYDPSNPVPVGTNSLVVWDLDQGSGTTAADLANPILDGNNAGTLTGPAVSWTTGKFNGGVHFLGGSAAGQPDKVGYLITPISGSLFTNKQVCMVAWIKPTQINPTFGFNYIMGWRGPDSSYAFLRFNTPTELGFGVRVRTLGGTYQWAEVSYPMPFDVLDGTWRQVAGTFNDGTLKIYVNGVEVASYNSGYTSAANYYIVPPSEFHVGGVFDDPADTRLNYAGDIDDVRLMNFVPALEPTPPPPPPTAEFSPDPRTVVLWHLNEGSGTTTVDAATPVLDGPNTGTIDPGSTVWTASGRFGNGLVSTANFATGCLKTSLGTGLFTTEATMDAWIRPTDVDIDGSYVMGWTGSADELSFVRLNSATEVSVGFRVNNGTDEYWAQIGNFNTGVNLLDGMWRHIAGTYHNGVVRIFLDGALKATFDSGYASGWMLSQPHTFVAAGSTPWDPNRTDGYRYVGDIDEVRLSNVARSDFSSAVDVSIAAFGNEVVVTYSGVLQSASAITNEFKDVSGATSPYTNSASGGPMFFRSRTP